jgi:hypothetical protein
MPCAVFAEIGSTIDPASGLGSLYDIIAYGLGEMQSIITSITGLIVDIKIRCNDACYDKHNQRNKKKFKYGIYHFVS